MNDLWAFGWNELLIPEALTMNYSELHEDPAGPVRKDKYEQRDFGSKESIV